MKMHIIRYILYSLTFNFRIISTLIYDIDPGGGGGGGYFHMYAYLVCAARETPIFSREYPFRSI